MVRVDSRSLVTREAILTTAEQLFAEQGIFAVSNRQISEAAGQGNNAAVGYHFGTKNDLLEAIARRHSEPIEELRAEQLQRVGTSDDLRTWLACMVQPITDYLDRLGSPTWFARFAAQVMADPSIRDVLVDEVTFGPALRETAENLSRCLPQLPGEVLAERTEITRNVVLQTCADRERALATGRYTPRRTWADAATGVVDALVGLWTAPITTAPSPRRPGREQPVPTDLPG